MHINTITDDNTTHDRSMMHNTDDTKTKDSRNKHATAQQQQQTIDAQKPNMTTPQDSAQPQACRESNNRFCKQTSSAPALPHPPPSSQHPHPPPTTPRYLCLGLRLQSCLLLHLPHVHVLADATLLLHRCQVLRLGLQRHSAIDAHGKGINAS